MPAHGGWVAVLIIAGACGGGPSGAPVPADLKVRLTFGGRPQSGLRYEVRQTFDVQRPAIGPYEETVAYLRESVSESLGAHHVTGQPDSILTTAHTWKRPPLPAFDGWFNDQRVFLDSLIRSDSGERYRTLGFSALLPFPNGPVGVGARWAAPEPYHVQVPMFGPVSAHANGTLRRIEVVDGDTVAIIGIHLTVQQIVERGDDERGELSGEERFSVTRGVTTHLKLSGRLERTSQVDGPVGIQHITVPFQVSLERTLLP